MSSVTETTEGHRMNISVLLSASDCAEWLCSRCLRFRDWISKLGSERLGVSHSSESHQDGEMFSALRPERSKRCSYPIHSKENKIMLFVEKWVKFEIIMLSGTQQTQTSTTWILLCDKSRFKLCESVCTCDMKLERNLWEGRRKGKKKEDLGDEYMSKIYYMCVCEDVIIKP